MEIPTKYNPAESEDKWYKYWMDKGFFHSVPDEREAYTIVIPPPNVTGVLHMGHMLNNTIQDVLVRRARLQGKNVCWVPGTDHASIATEAKVVNKLREEGISKEDITRDEFMKHAWEWKEKHGGIILEQLKKLGASCDWERTAFTMDESLYDSVIDVFIDLYNKEKIYRGVRMVNWDPSAQTAVSDEEVIHKELQSKLYYLRYQVEGSEEYITIATTRPETILGDTAVCINPKDERFAHLRGKRCIVPLVNRSIPIIEDEYVDMEFGTGALKITPAHDIHDYEIGDRHNLESIDIFNDNGTMSEAAQLYIGKDRFEVRDLILPDLEKAGNLVKVEDYVNKVGFSERTDAVIEPKLSMQWFLNMKELAEPALEHVMNDDIQLHPAKFKNTYRHWMENVKDWCISRQLWWGQRIPVYYLPEGGYVVAKTIEEALVTATAKTGKTYQSEDLRQDEDVLDTWFSSWLWPLSVFDGIRNPENEEIKYYYPTNDLVSGPDILFFWIARMVIAGYEYKGEKPFSNVYLTGIVRDEQGRKMSKSLGNSPDPLDLIEKYGADGVRVGMLLCSPAGGDLLFNENLPEQGRNFTTKIWNAFRLVKGWEVADIEQPEYARIATEVFHARLNNTMEQLDEQFKQYRISEALMTVYTLFRDEFSSWYLEMVKPAYQQPIDKKTFDSTVALFEKLMQLLHPFMPFLTEEIWQLLADRSEEDSIMVSVMPKPDSYDADLLAKFDQVKEVIVAVRNIRKQKNIAFKEVLEMNYKAKGDNYDASFDCVVAKMCNLKEISTANGEMAGAMSFIVNAIEYFIPLGDLVNVEEEIKKMEDELKYTQGFLMSVQKKMSNERFVNNAPAKVIEIEKKKMADAEAKIKVLEDRIASMK
ncbi:valine--tRNA ligase [Ancylomarina sp. DW003]|uniref:Valine--tRNA ligase n=1 Tax=Paralabilibaculum antarcticum TaxID=2912572 RepID=A0ABT5VY59_9BACT|nr:MULTISPECIES: valine--tRNA ligase [Marinifilaceae]MDE5420341.1 valine--tRNA ligase [Labilibaculum sp. DW002]MDE5423879.1 valine--tRNA ligase [Ancylomarina sp. DW003]